MKKITLFLLLTLCLGNIQAKNSLEVHLGAAIPYGSFSEYSVDNILLGGTVSAGSAGTGIALGLKYTIPLNDHGLSAALNADLLYNGMNYGFREWAATTYDDAHSKLEFNLPNHINIPITVGLNQALKLSKTSSFFVEATIGCNYSKISDFSVIGEYYLYNGGNYFDYSMITSYSSALNLCGNIEAGFLLKNISLRLRYLPLGSYKMDWKKDVTGDYNNEHEHGTFKKYLDIKSTVLSIGYRF